MRRWVVVGGCGGGGAVVGLYIMATREWIKINFLFIYFYRALDNNWHYQFSSKSHFRLVIYFAILVLKYQLFKKPIRFEFTIHIGILMLNYWFFFKFWVYRIWRYNIYYGLLSLSFVWHILPAWNHDDIILYVHPHTHMWRTWRTWKDIHTYRHWSSQERYVG